MNLANLGLTGLLAAKQRLQVTGHNLNNVDTEGYNRQSVLTQTSRPSATSAGFVGRGVEVVTVQRAYDGFLHKQLSNAQSQGAALIAYGNEINKLDSLFSDPSTGISPAMLRFFEGMQAVASAPADAASRQELLGRAASLVTQMNDNSAYLRQVSENINTQIGTAVSQVNSYLERIQSVNNQIMVAQGSNPGHAPNDLLDLRDQLVTELGQLVDIQAVEQNGRVSISTSRGQLLLGADTVYPLHAMRSAADPSKVVLGYTSSFDAQGQPIKAEFKDTAVTGGSLGGLLKFRHETLEPTSNNLGRMALGLASAFNELHQAGEDLHGKAGEKFFGFNDALKSTQVKSNAHNSAGSGTPGFNISDATRLSNRDYELSFNDGVYRLRTLPDGTLNPLTDELMKELGFQIDVSGLNPTANDSWLIQPTRNAAENLQLAITDPDRIAAAGVGTGTANGDNALKMAELQNSKVLAGGTLSLNEGFSQIVNQVAVNTQQNATAAKAQAKLIQQNYAAQQAVSGVNEDEEYLKLDRYQEQYRAAARLIDISSQLFDTLLGLRT